MNTRRVRPWTDDEIGFLLDNAHLSARRLGEELGRGMQSVQHMRNKLRAGWSPEKPSWSESEIDFVRATPNLTAAEVARHLGRSRSAVENRRQILRETEGMAFDAGGRKNPYEIGSRRLLAKTCLGCGLLLDASWFSPNQGGRGRMKNWRPRCNRCAYDAQKEAGGYRSGHEKDGGASARTSAARLQAITREHAVNHGNPWTDRDHQILRDSTLLTVEKAIKLGRTWSATHAAVKQNGYTSRVGKGDPMRGRWVIDNPNAAGATA